MRRSGKRGLFWIIVTILFFASLLATPSAKRASASEPGGRVEKTTPRLRAVREGAETDLAVGSPVYEFDILRTNATGTGTIRFADDSVLELRGDTEVDIREVVFSENRNRFNIGLAEGAARVVTGAIVRLNPGGFRITTPRSTIGIRGTDLEVAVDPGTGVETVTVNHIGEARAVTIRDRVSGTVTDVTAGGVSYSITPDTGAITINGRPPEKLGASSGGRGAGVSVTTRDGTIYGDAPRRTGLPENETGSGGDGNGNDGSASGSSDSGGDGGKGDGGQDSNR
ncbi:MAG: FecR family protein [Synergistaceae bacterium]|nr:FecR family protein [Synergistaceae bacterium]